MPKLRRIKSRNLFYIPILIYLVITLPSLILIPFSRYDKITVLGVNILYISLFLFSTIIFRPFFSRCRFYRHRKNLRSVNIKAVETTICICALASLIGITLLTYDRVFIKAIDYSAGLRAARYQWLNSDVGSTIVGKMGNILIPFSYAGLYFAYMNWEKISLAVVKVLAVVTGCGVPLIHAMLNGGRSNLLILIIFVLTISVMRLLQGMPMIPLKKAKGPLILLAFAVIFAYVWSVFVSSASMSGISIKEYCSNLIYELGGQVDIASTSAFTTMAVMLLAYAYHGNWTMGYLMGRVTTGYYSSSMFSTIISVLGLSELNFNTENWEGAFLNVPATFYHDFGYAGIVVSALITGSLFSYSILLATNSKGISNIELVFIALIWGYVFLSPMVFLFGLTYYKFVFFALIVVGIFWRILYGRVNYN